MRPNPIAWLTIQEPSRHPRTRFIGYLGQGPSSLARPHNGRSRVDPGIRLVTRNAEADHAALRARGVNVVSEVLRFGPGGSGHRCSRSAIPTETSSAWWRSWGTFPKTAPGEVPHLVKVPHLVSVMSRSRSNRADVIRQPSHLRRATTAARPRAIV